MACACGLSCAERGTRQLLDCRRSVGESRVNRRVCFGGPTSTQAWLWIPGSWRPSSQLERSNLLFTSALHRARATAARVHLPCNNCAFSNGRDGLARSPFARIFSTGTSSGSAVTATTRALVHRLRHSHDHFSFPARRPPARTRACTHAQLACHLVFFYTHCIPKL
jgi:hypothetical protein